MTREEKCLLAIEKGYTYNPETGEIFGMRGNVITRKTDSGYIDISIHLKDKKYLHLKGHIFGWYFIYKEIVDQIDHINGDRIDNRMINLRASNNQLNKFNYTKAKGYSWCKRKKQFSVEIQVNYIKHRIGYFDTEEEAREAYLKAKEIYHIII